MWRRFFNSGNDNFMATGVAVKWLYKQPEGTIILDPTVSLTPPTDDVWIEKDKDTNFNSYAQIRIGKGASFPLKRSLVRFDVSAVPPNASIQSASMQLYFYGGYGPAVNRSIQCHQVLKLWKQAEATWYKPYSGANNWNIPGLGFDGIDAKATPEASLDWFNEYNTWKIYDLTTLTQQWVNGSQSNYGVIFWATNEAMYDDRDEKWCYASEYSDTSKRPKLVVTLTVNPLVDIAYDALSRPATITYANGVTETNVYDPNRGWLTRRDYQKSGSNIYYLKSDVPGDYDQAGNLKKVEYKHYDIPNDPDPPETMEYVYWADYRLKQFKYNSVVRQNYNYDANGNRITYVDHLYSYGYNNNQLTEDESFEPGNEYLNHYDFDKAGRVKTITLDGTPFSVTHDIRDNMTAHGSNTYAYDAFSQRIRKTEGGTSKYYVTSGPQILAEYKSTNELEAEYIYALGRMIAKLDPSKGYLWFYVDHLGSTRLVDGPDSQTDMRRDYFPYGQAYLAAGTDQTAYQFTGKELDNMTGLYYFGARYYDRSIGRWLVPDPIVSDFSPYSYAHNSPLQYVDPDGQSWFPVWLGLNLVNLFFNEARGPRVRNGSIGGNSYINPGIRPSFGRSGFVDDFSGRGLAETARAYANYRHYGLTGSGIPILVTPDDIGRYNRKVLTNAARDVGKYGLKTAGFIWSLPNTVIGLGAWAINAAATGKPEFVGFDREHWVWGWRNTWYPFGFGAGLITFGHVVLANDSWDEGFDDFYYKNHELVHVLQNNIFGPLFFPIYVSNWLINLRSQPELQQFGINVNPYRHVLFEIWAYYVENLRRRR